MLSGNIESLEVDVVDTRGGHPRPEAVEEDAVVVQNEEEPEKKVRISSHLPEEKVCDLLSLLKEYKDLFAWTSNNMSRASLGNSQGITSRSKIGRS
ncbi:unnamed protein product [Linum trigynum]|uniref:Uncharacterized protein n=1 Tax=Linum trigynum TaxID=586398 RepID=A0AAV2CHE4_9ROSI